MKKMIDLYLISGFLGSGKTTFLKQLLEQSNHKRIGVIVNEFGSVGIDGKILQKNGVEMIEINNGSIFCACLKGTFVQTLANFLEAPIDILFVEASGMADPTSMQNLIEQLAEIMKNKPVSKQAYSYKGSICLIDAARFLELHEIFLPAIHQVQKSSLIVLNKIDEVTEDKTEELEAKLHELNWKAHLFATTFGRVPLEIIESKVVPEGVVNNDDTFNTIRSRPITYTIDMKDDYDVQKVKEFAIAISDSVLRFKGFFSSDQGIYRADCVGDYIQIEKSEYQEEELEGLKKLVLIGKNNIPFDEKIESVWKDYFSTKTISFVRK